jgi:hypothetical protein
MNSITPSYEGISERDFKMGRMMIRGVINSHMQMNNFKPIMKVEMARMMMYKPET